MDMLKSESPFYPGRPVPVEYFVGRKPEIERIVTRGVRQVSSGKPISIFVEGEYGIGKSSVAKYVQTLAEKEFGLHGIYAVLGGSSNLDDVAAAVLDGTVRSGAFDPRRLEVIRNWLARYIGKQETFGFSLNFDVLKSDAALLAKPFGMLGFLEEAYGRLKDTGAKGIFLIMDEINGITSNPQFSYFIKSLIDSNAVARKSLPLLLMLCGVRQRRYEMIRCHQPVDRIFDVVEISVLTEAEMREFFQRSFATAQMTMNDDALDVLTDYSAGFPKMMQIIGDAAYWTDKDGVVDKADALRAVVAAAEEIGRKYVDEQVYEALRSKDYRSILAKIGEMGPNSMSFLRSDIASGLTSSEQKKLTSFLQKMKSLHVLRSGDLRGEYVFNMRMVRLYIWLRSLRKEDETR